MLKKHTLPVMAESQVKANLLGLRLRQVQHYG